MGTLWAALCLVAVLEGLLLFATPRLWKRTMAQMQGQTESQLRLLSAVPAPVRENWKPVRTSRTEMPETIAVPAGERLNRTQLVADVATNV